MSHQTGIQANEQLRGFFGKCRQNNDIRIIAVTIENEALSLKDSYAAEGSWADDYQTYITAENNLLNPNQPIYLLIRLDSQENGNYQWMLLTWSPDTSPVRQKMLYASTKATLKNEFGAGQIKEDVFASVLSEATYEGYLRQKRDKEDLTNVPLTSAEAELALLKKTETHSDIGIDTKFQTLQGIAFPIHPDAQKACGEFLRGKLDYVRFKIDLTKEEILLDLTVGSLEDRKKLETLVPEKEPRYHIFRFAHDHEGDYLTPVIFAYSMPGCGCSIRERMLYSSCKNPFLAMLEQQVGFVIDKKLEIDSGEELNADNLREELHPTKTLQKLKFNKPKPPGGAKRGPPRK